MPRARGANAVCALAFESALGTPPGSGYVKLPFVSVNLGEEQGLLASDLLGYGRDPLAPTLDVANDDGDITVPVDLRAIGHHLRGLCGAATTAASVAPYGEITFSAQPAASSTITINGVAWTFVASGATGNQTNIGANLAATLTALATNLNASVNASITPATYGSTATKLTVTHDTAGPAGNAFTLAAAANSNGVASAATLLGGANKHTFVMGGQSLPSATLEVGLPDVPSYGQNFGVRWNNMRISARRSGLLNAVINLIAQGENRLTASGAGSPSDIVVERFAQFSGDIRRNNVVIGGIETADIALSNNLEKVETIQATGRIEDADPGVLSATGEIVARFQNTTLVDQAITAPCELRYGWSIALGKTLTIIVHEVYLPKPKRPVEGPGGVRTRFPWQAARSAALGKTVTIELVNDVAAYA